MSQVDYVMSSCPQRDWTKLRNDLANCTDHGDWKCHFFSFNIKRVSKIH